MINGATIFSIFVSSPNDVTSDRDRIVAAIISWNQRNSPSRGIFFNPLTWEQTVSPDIGSSGQAVINEQIGDSYDIYLGVMWSRFGTKTKDADSGTEDEFNQAVSRHENGQKITVCFLFNNSPIPQDILDGNQYQKIQEFKAKISGFGCLYREYSDHRTLIEVVNIILDRAANDLTNGPSASQAVEVPKAIPPEQVGTESAVGEQIDELGVLDLREMLDEESEKFSTLMGEFSERLSGLGVEAGATTDEISAISRFGQIEPKVAKGIINKLATYIEGFCDWGDQSQSEIESSMQGFSSAFAQLVNISEDFDEREEDIKSAIESGKQLINTASEKNCSLKELSNTVLSMPRMSKEMIKACKRLSGILDAVIINNNTFATNVGIEVEQLTKKL